LRQSRDRPKLPHLQRGSDVLSPPRSLAARTFTDIRHWTRMPKGGHFAALEQPELLAADIIAFFAGLG